MHQGKIVVFEVGKDNQQLAQQILPTYVPSTDPELPDLKTSMLVLVNGNTASAAEVLAAALKVGHPRHYFLYSLAT
jgi:C-terminal processing protease CtpA/Prc